MKIVHLISSGGFYGAEQCLLNLATEQARLGHDVNVCAFENSQDPHTEVAEKAAAAGIRTEIFPCRNRVDLRAALAIHKYLKSQQADILHCHGYKADCYGYLASRACGTKLVSTCHNWCRDSKTASYESVDKFVLRAFDKVVAITGTVAEELLRSGVEREKVEVIENGVPVSDAASVSAGANSGETATIATIARLAPDKRIGDLLIAAAEILRTHPRTRFLIVGEGPQRAELEAIARKLSIADNVTFTGYLSDVSRVYSTIDVLVLPSLNEGTPMSILEAMAAGKPVVATRVGGIPKVVTDGVTGLLVEPADPAALAQALKKLIANRELCAHMGEQGRVIAKEKFSSSRMAARYLSLYKAVLGEDSSAAMAAAERTTS